MRVDQLSTRSRQANITCGLDSCADSPEPGHGLTAERCFARSPMPSRPIKGKTSARNPRHEGRTWKLLHGRDGLPHLDQSVDRLAPMALTFDEMRSPERIGRAGPPSIALDQEIADSICTAVSEFPRYTSQNTFEKLALVS